MKYTEFREQVRSDFIGRMPSHDQNALAKFLDEEEELIKEGYQDAVENDDPDLIDPFSAHKSSLLYALRMMY